MNRVCPPTRARLGEMGVDRARILHTAQSLFHDHVPATAFGLATAWIDRRHGRDGWGTTAPPAAEARIDFGFTGLADLVDRHRAAVDRQARRRETGPAASDATSR